MDKRDIFKSVYEDFFGINKIQEENDKLYEDIKKLKNIDDNEKLEDYPVINVERKEEKDFHTIEEKNKKLEELYKEIDELYIKDESKDLLKKIIEYIRKYNENIEKQFISFNMAIYGDNKETINSILRILNEAINYFSYMKSGDIGKISFYDLDDVKELEEINSLKHNIISFENFNVLYSKEQNIKEKIIYKMNEYIEENQRNILTVLIAKNKEELNDLFLMSDSLKNEFSEFEISERRPDVQDVYQMILDKLKDKVELTDEMKIKLLDYISTTYVNSDKPFVKYRDDLYEKIIFNKEIPEYEKDKTLDEIFEELNSLVGLSKVKKMLNELVSLIELKNKTKEDLKIKDINLHMVFLGNPGTGKTTVARIVANILYNLKYIKQNKLIEVSSKDLVAEYVGQTAPKTMSVIQKALGGVLFIDEAYSLASGKGQSNSYNEEAIATLIQAMENYRDELVVIFAGYTKEMQDFLNSNSGIVSRVGYTVEFEDYTVDELIEIFNGMMKKSGFIVSKEAENKAKEVIKEYKNYENFGNARFVRNLYEKTIVKHASNTEGKKDKKLLKTIKEKDISTDNLLKM